MLLEIIFVKNPAIFFKFKLLQYFYGIKKCENPLKIL